MNKRKDDPVANTGGTPIETLLTRPRNVAIVALGRSVGAFVYEMIARGSRGTGDVFDEVWTLNRGLRTFAHSKMFCMDDMKWLQQKDKAYHDWLKKHPLPVITSTVYSGYENHVAYPLQEVLEFIEVREIILSFSMEGIGMQHTAVVPFGARGSATGDVVYVELARESVTASLYPSDFLEEVLGTAPRGRPG